MVDNRFYVYEWFIKDTGEVFYVGKGTGKRYKDKSSRNNFFTDMFNTHNCDVRIVLDNLTENDAFTKEKELIKYYKENTNFRLTNVTDGGEGASGRKHTDEEKKLMSISSKERWNDPLFREKMMNIRSSSNSPYKSEEFRNKISKLVIGENNPNYKHYWSKEQKEHLSQKAIQSGRYIGENNPNSKSIICLETGEVFHTIKDALEKYDVPTHGSFSVVFKNKYRTAAGLHWMLYDDRLNDPNIRFQELLQALKESPKIPVVCLETREVFSNRQLFLDSFHIGIKFFKSHYSPDTGIQINNQTYFLLEDYLGRFV